MTLTAGQLMRSQQLSYLHRVAPVHSMMHFYYYVFDGSRERAAKTEFNYMQFFLNIIRVTIRPYCDILSLATSMIPARGSQSSSGTSSRFFCDTIAKAARAHAQ
jgi:hypothetical protein